MIEVTPDIEAKIERHAAERGITTIQFVEEAVLAYETQLDVDVFRTASEFIRNEDDAGLLAFAKQRNPARAAAAAKRAAA